MWIRLKLLSLLSRPIVVPFVVGLVGASYGSFKLSRKALQLVLPGDKAPETYSNFHYFTGLTSGSVLIAVRERFLPPPVIPKAYGGDSSVGRIAASVQAHLQQLRPIYRGQTMIVASVLTAIVVEGMHSNSNSIHNQRRR
jgi:hypothetical protein